MRRGLVYALTLVTGAALAVGSARFFASRSDDQPVATRTPITRLVPAPGQSFVTGQIESLSAHSAQAAPLAAPFSLVPPGQGEATATIENALIDGERTTIFWGGAGPLPLRGDGAIDLSGADVTIDSSGVVWSLSGGWPLEPGTYDVGAPVAVGSEGLASSREGVSFEADTRTVINTSEVVIEVDSSTLEVSGPGSVSAKGDLTVTDESGTHGAGSIDLEDGPYEVTVSEQGGMLVLDATLQGPLKAG